MTRLIVILLLLFSGPLPAADAPHGAEIRLDVPRKETAWVGERVAVNLEIWTDALSFSDQTVRLPEIEGAYLMLTDSSTWPRLQADSQG